MTLTDDLVTLNTAVADPLDADVDLLDAFAPAQHLLGGSADYQRLRLRAATRFLEQHLDLGVWMTRPIEQRLVDVRGRRQCGRWSRFALISTRVRADDALKHQLGATIERAVADVSNDALELGVALLARFGRRHVRGR